MIIILCALNRAHTPAHCMTLVLALALPLVLYSQVLMLRLDDHYLYIEAKHAQSKQHMALLGGSIGVAIALSPHKGPGDGASVANRNVRFIALVANVKH